MNHVTRFLLILFSATLLFQCNKDDVDRAKVDDEKIQQYLKDNNLTATKHESGIYFIIGTPGSGGSPKLSSTVRVFYKGYFLDKKVFDQTAATPVSFPLSNLIKGWQIAIPLLQKGGKGTFFIPSELGYGAFPPQGIPANAVLAFDIELVDFN